jgi:hypothetical protein
MTRETVQKGKEKVEQIIAADNGLAYWEQASFLNYSYLTNEELEKVKAYAKVLLRKRKAELEEELMMLE